MLDLRQPPFSNMILFCGGSSGTADKNNTSINITKWPQQVVVFLASKVVEADCQGNTADSAISYISVRASVITWAVYSNVRSKPMGKTVEW